MDTLTHALSGALLARATQPAAPGAGELPRRTRVWLGFWAAAFPDSDIVVLLLDPLTYLTTHRGITHSVVMLPVWTAVLGLAVWLLLRRRYSWRAITPVIALGIAIHIGGDVITAFGTMVLAPLTDWRLQLPTTFIIDPYFTAILIAGLAASSIWRATRQPAVFALAVLAGYIGLQGIMHQRAVAIGTRYVADQHLTGTAVSALPQPFSPFNWMVVLEGKDSYHLAYVDLLTREAPAPVSPEASWLRRVAASYRPEDQLQWQRIARFGDAPIEAQLAERVWHSASFSRFRRFALFPALYRIDRAGDRRCVWFNDLRFALVGRDMPFRYGLCGIDGTRHWDVYRLVNDGSGREIAEPIVRPL
jgi:inner membrane protein